MRENIEVDKLGKALKKVGGLDQVKLHKVAKTAPKAFIREAAVEKLIDAVEKLTDQAVLTEVAKNDSIKYVRKAAVEKLTDQAVLADIAKSDSNKDVRKAAVEKLTDQAVLTEVAKNDSKKYVRKAAVEKLTDQAVLADIAKSDSNKDVRKAAVEKLTDQAALAEVAKNASDIFVRKSAADLLPLDLLLDMYDKEPDVYCNVGILNSICRRKKDWLNNLSQDELNRILDYLQQLNECPYYITDALLHMYKSGKFKDIIKVHGEIVVNKDKHHDYVPNACGAEHTDFTKTEYLRDRL